MDAKERRELIWRLFVETSPYTGFLIGWPQDALMDNLLKLGFIQRVVTEWDKDDMPKMYQITEAGDQAIRDEHQRDVWKKPSLRILDSFTDGAIIYRG